MLSCTKLQVLKECSQVIFLWPQFYCTDSPAQLHCIVSQLGNNLSKLSGIATNCYYNLVSIYLILISFSSINIEIYSYLAGIMSLTVQLALNTELTGQ